MFKDLRAFLEKEAVKREDLVVNAASNNMAGVAESIAKAEVNKYLIIDRLKAIFATERKITDLSSLKAIVDKRNNAYQDLMGPNGKTLSQLGINIDSKAFANTLENIDQVVDPGLVGFTAFYRKGTQEGRGLSLTALGETKVLGGKMQKLTGDQEQAAKERFF